MCLGELAQVVAVVPGSLPTQVAVCEPGTGKAARAISLVDGLQPGDHVIVHAGHVVQRVSATAFDDAAALRASHLDSSLEPS